MLDEIPPLSTEESAQLDAEWSVEMTPVTEPSMQLLTRKGRRKKFTPECIQQIKNLLERGKSREEIAELLDVTVGSLQVTCSRLGISLRRSRPTVSRRVLSLTTEQHQQGSQLVSQARTMTEQRTQTENSDAIEASFAIRIQYKGEERTTELPLTNTMINRLALEAEFRDMRFCEVVSELLINTIKNDLLRAPSSGRVARTNNGSYRGVDRSPVLSLQRHASATHIENFAHEGRTETLIG
jgi:hypothetical protein